MPTRMAKIRTTNTKCWKECGTCIHCYWECKMTQSSFKDSLVVSYNVKHMTPAIPLLGIYWGNCTQMFILVLCILAPNWRKPKCLSTGECIKEPWYIHTMDYFSTVKRNGLRIYAVTWMTHKIFMRKEVLSPTVA